MRKTSANGSTRPTRKTPARRHRVAIVVDDDVSPFELAIACEVFGIDRSDLGVPWYDARVCAVRPGRVRAQSGFDLDVTHGLEEVRRADTVYVSPAMSADREPAPELLDALRAAHARGARILSVCTSAFTVAAAGLLDGRRATTHWMHSGDLARRYPDVKVDCNVLYIDEGDVLTSAGTAAGIDLCLHVVRNDFGADIANAVARRMVVPPHRDGGQAQYIDAPVPDGADADLFTDTLTWLQSNLGEAVSVDHLAQRSAMSPRTFARKFRAVTGTTPHRWLTRQRVLLAQRLLETTDLSVEQIASRCGFGTAAGLRDQFHRAVRTSPTAYRATFRQDLTLVSGPTMAG